MSTPRKRSWIWPGLALVASAICGLWVHHGAREMGARSLTAGLVTIRQAVFAELTRDPRLFRATPDEASAAGFLRDTSRPPTELLRAATTTVTDPLIAVTSLLREAKWQNSPFCMPGGSLAEKVQGLSRGKTCCSDNVELLLGQLELEGFFARELHTKRHVVAEVFAPALSRWVFVDPSYGIMAFDPSGSPMSLFDVRADMLAGKSIDLRFVGGELARGGKVTPHQVEFYASPEKLESLSLVLGNNVFDIDHARAGHHLPEAIRQAIGLLRGSEPRTLVYVDEHSSEGRQIAALRPALIALAGSLLWLTSLLTLRLRRRSPIL